jgi:DNA-binding transcriptional LysR family regulator
MPTLTQLASLVTAAQTGSLTATARKLHLTQPAVSQQIAALEAEAGVRLLMREHRGVTPTQAGAALVEHAGAALQRIDHGLRVAADIGNGGLGVIRIAAFPTASAALLPTAIASLRQRCPRIQVVVEELETPDGLQRIRDGACDLVVGFEYWHGIHPDVTVVPLFDDPLYVALPYGHPAGVQDPVVLRAIAAEPWIRAGYEADDEMLVKLCADAGFIPELGPVTSNHDTAQGLVAGGLGVALVPQLAIDTHRQDIHIRRLEAAPVRHIFVCTRAGDPNPPALMLTSALREATAAHVSEARDIPPMSDASRAGGPV